VGPQHGQSIRSHVYAPARETAAAAPASDNGVRAAAHVQPPVQEAPQPNQQAPQPLPPPPPPQQQQQQQQQVAPPSLDLGDAAGYWDLLMHPDTEATIARAKSASDASLLRRKGHLKEQVTTTHRIARHATMALCAAVVAAALVPLPACVGAQFQAARSRMSAHHQPPPPHTPPSRTTSLSTCAACTRRTRA
jgi:hypothetical protein